MKFEDGYYWQRYPHESYKGKHIWRFVYIDTKENEKSEIWYLNTECFDILEEELKKGAIFVKIELQEPAIENNRE